MVVNLLCILVLHAEEVSSSALVIPQLDLSTTQTSSVRHGDRLAERSLAYPFQRAYAESELLLLGADSVVIVVLLQADDELVVLLPAQKSHFLLLKLEKKQNVGTLPQASALSDRDTKKIAEKKIKNKLPAVVSLVSGRIVHTIRLGGLKEVLDGGGHLHCEMKGSSRCGLQEGRRAD